MAGLNLVPNPTIILTQAGIFLTALVVVKKLYVQPYLRLRDKRSQATFGSKDLAADLLRENVKSQQSINDRLAQAARESQSIVERARLTAQEKREAVVKAADQDVSQTLVKLRQEIAHNITEEKQKIAGVVQNLSKMVYEKIVQ